MRVGSSRERHDIQEPAVTRKSRAIEFWLVDCAVKHAKLTDEIHQRVASKSTSGSKSEAEAAPRMNS